MSEQRLLIISTFNLTVEQIQSFFNIPVDELSAEILQACFTYSLLTWEIAPDFEHIS